MNTGLNAIQYILELHLDIISRLLKQHTKSELMQPASKHSNHPLFLCLHLADARYTFLQELFDITSPDFFAPFEHAKSQADIIEFPDPKELLPIWLATGSLFKEHLPNLTPSDWQKTISFTLPKKKKATRSDALQFCLHHESYHIGQMGLIRKINDQTPLSSFYS